MEHARKWILSPTDETQDGISEEEFHLILRMVSKNLIDKEGKLLSKTNGKYIGDSSAYQNLLNKKKSKYFDRFLELKALLSTEKPLKTQRTKKTKWDLDDD